MSFTIKHPIALSEIYHIQRCFDLLTTVLHSSSDAIATPGSERNWMRLAEDPNTDSDLIRRYVEIADHVKQRSLIDEGTKIRSRFQNNDSIEDQLFMELVNDARTKPISDVFEVKHTKWYCRYYKFIYLFI